MKKVRPIKKVKKVRLPKGGVLQVVVPDDHVPLVVPMLDEGVVEIVPVPAKEAPKRGWWQF